MINEVIKKEIDTGNLFQLIVYLRVRITFIFSTISFTSYVIFKMEWNSKKKAGALKILYEFFVSHFLRVEIVYKIAIRVSIPIHTAKNILYIIVNSIKLSREILWKFSMKILKETFSIESELNRGWISSVSSIQR